MECHHCGNKNENTLRFAERTWLLHRIKMYGAGVLVDGEYEVIDEGDPDPEDRAIYCLECGSFSEVRDYGVIEWM